MYYSCYKNQIIHPRDEGIEMRWNKKHLVLGICICVAFVLLGAFAGASVALVSARWHVEEGELVHTAVDNAVMHSYEKSCGYKI
ncbi:hypothetical protein CW714_07625 [Methanophagales archaeon]|nr:MAG: hypothetical protein CW714_07625 [Methanophagales archaeon]